MKSRGTWDVMLIGGRHRHAPYVNSRLVELEHFGGVCLMRAIDFGRAGIFYERYDWHSVNPETCEAVAQYARLERPNPLYPIGRGLDPARIP